MKGNVGGFYILSLILSFFALINLAIYFDLIMLPLHPGVDDISKF